MIISNRRSWNVSSVADEYYLMNILLIADLSIGCYFTVLGGARCIMIM